MTKKKVSLNKTEDLTSVDAELDAAMDRLVDTNERITTLLTNIDAGGDAEPSDTAATVDSPADSEDVTEEENSD